MANLLSNAECGPSNALQAFSKHSQKDTTLQQDRWFPESSIRQVLSFRKYFDDVQESFRTPDTNGRERASFQRDAQLFFDQGRLPSPAGPTQFQRMPLQPFQPHRVEEDWSQQFQRLDLSTALPGQIMTPNQLGRQSEQPSPSPWHEEFALVHTRPSQQFSYQPQVQHRLTSMTYSTGVPLSQTAQMPVVNPILDDEAFELAFAEVENAIHGLAPEPEPVQEEPKSSSEEEADQLAQTAGELYDKLQHERDTNEKFRNSTFMTLMRRLRDREVVVAGNDMVEATSVRTNEEKTSVEENVSM